MKITITKAITELIEIPPYFKLKKHFYMIMGDNCYLRICNPGFEPDLGLFPQMKFEEIRFLRHEISSTEEKIIPISENEFKLEFIKTTLEIEKNCN